MQNFLCKQSSAYENLINIYYARRTHKLHEWHDLCDWIMSLPYAEQLIAVKADAPESEC